MKRIFIVLLTLTACLSLSFQLSFIPAHAQSDDLRVAFVSNRTGTDNIFLMSLEGESELIANLTNHPARDWKPAWSPDGARIAFNSNRDGANKIYTMNADGSGVTPLFPGQMFHDLDPAWSPDGTRFAFVSNRAGMGYDLYIAGINGGDLTRLTSNNAIKGDPTWSPDGSAIAFWERQLSGEIHVYRINVENQQIARLSNAGPFNGSTIWAAQDDFIYFDSNRDGAWHIYRMMPNGNFPTRVSEEGVNSGRPALAPDGEQIAFVSDRGFSDEIYVMNVDGTGLRQLTDSASSDHSPAWQPQVPDAALSLQVTPLPADEDEGEDSAEDDLLAIGIGQNVSGVDALLQSQRALLNDYGIDAWHNAGWRGEGRRIGVIDTAFGGISDFIDRFEVEVTVPFTDSLIDYHNSNNPHGTYTLEIAHVVAPGADLYICRYDGTLPGLTRCANWMLENNVHIINHSVGLPVLPLDGRGEWAAFVNDIHQRNILWVNSAGNFNQGYLEFAYSDDGAGYHRFTVGTIERSELIFDTGGHPYTGYIMLSWEDAGFDFMDIEDRPNFALEVYGSDGTTLIAQAASIGEEMATQDTLTTSRVVRLQENADGPFAVRIRNNGGPIDRLVRMALFVEFAPLDNITGLGSTITPADARFSLTVGSVNARRELAAYSSRGLAIPDYVKPDLSAPGEIIMSDGTPFIGTSAAAPVVAGIAALLWQERPSYFTDTLFPDLKTQWVIPTDSQAYGTGIIQLRPPTSSRLQVDETLQIELKTVFPQPDEDEIVVDTFSCVGSIVTRFDIGVTGYINYNLGLAMRSAPSTSASQLRNLFLGETFTVTGGPDCIAPLTWWEIELEDGSTGWISEGGSYYFASPVNLARAELPTEYDGFCPTAPTPQLEIGGRAVVTAQVSGGISFYRRTGGQNLIAGLPRGTLVHVLGGPVCEGSNNNVLRWYVRVLEGRWAGNEGWLAEGATGQRFMEPSQ